MENEQKEHSSLAAWSQDFLSVRIYATNADWETCGQLRNISKPLINNAKSNYYKECLPNNFKNKQLWNSIKAIINMTDTCHFNEIRDSNIIIHDFL